MKCLQIPDAWSWTTQFNQIASLEFLWLTWPKETWLSKQRNRHLQTILIEAAKMAPRNSPALAMIYDREKQKGNTNRATLAVARKMVAYLVAVDRRQKEFLVVENQKPHRRVGGGESGGFLQRAACQVLPGRGLGNGAQAPEAHLDMFRDWQELTNSIFCGGPRGRDSKWMSGSESLRNHRREAPTRAEDLKSFVMRFS